MQLCDNNFLSQQFTEANSYKSVLAKGEYDKDYDDDENELAITLPSGADNYDDDHDHDENDDD